MVGHNAIGFDNYVDLKSLPKAYTSIKIMKTSRAFLKLSFRAVSV